MESKVREVEPLEALLGMLALGARGVEEDDAVGEEVAGLPGREGVAEARARGDEGEGGVGDGVGNFGGGGVGGVWDLDGGV